jgi:hypothetical protein
MRSVTRVATLVFISSQGMLSLFRILRGGAAFDGNWKPSDSEVR